MHDIAIELEDASYSQSTFGLFSAAVGVNVEKCEKRDIHDCEN